jgi:hypothetical protein
MLLLQFASPAGAPNSNRDARPGDGGIPKPKINTSKNNFFFFLFFFFFFFFFFFSFFFFFFFFSSSMAPSRRPGITPDDTSSGRWDAREPAADPAAPALLELAALMDPGAGHGAARGGLAAQPGSTHHYRLDRHFGVQLTEVGF